MQHLHAVADDARMEAELLIARVLQVTRAQLMAETATPDATQWTRIESLAKRRAAGEPMAYVLGECGFWNLTLNVTPAVLIPRPDTETLVEWALELVSGAARLADLGTGSGCIALSLAKARPESQVLATDFSAAALAVAQSNAERNEIRNVQFLQGYWLQPLTGDFDLIVSNPPYIAEGDAHLPALSHEPRSALTSGVDGLDDLREIIATAPAHLAHGGWLLLEHGYDQSEQVRGLLMAAGYQAVQTRRDLGGNERVSGGQRA